MRYRQRYLDLIVNPCYVMFSAKRLRLISRCANFLTPEAILRLKLRFFSLSREAQLPRPFITHHNTLDIPLYLRIANELYLKRLIVGGFEGVYEFSKDFRNEGMDRTHNPEFTVMEIYIAYKDYNWMMNFTEENNVRSG